MTDVTPHPQPTVRKGWLWAASAAGLIAVIAVPIGTLALTHHANTPSNSSTNQDDGSTGTSGSTGISSGPTSEQLQQAYQAGFSRGEHMEFPSSFYASGAAANSASEQCRTNNYPSPEQNAQFDDGCMAGFSSGG